MTKEELEKFKQVRAQIVGKAPDGRGQWKPWTVDVDKVSSAVGMEVTPKDQLQMEAAKLDREYRRRLDPTGLGIYGVEESIEETVRRQNQR